MSGTDDEVDIESEPSGEVLVDGRSYTTPTEVDLERNDPHVARFNREEYRERAVRLERGLNWGGLLANIVVAGIVGASIDQGNLEFEDLEIENGEGYGLATFGVLSSLDLLTGAAYRVKPDDINVELERLPPRRIAAPPQQPGPEPTDSAPTYQSVVDTQIPETSMDRPNAVAVVIGNKTYQDDDIPNVDYAHRDAEIMKRYLTRTLGFREENIIYEKNATGSVLTRIFGTDATAEGQLYNWIKPGTSDVFVYYSGHGAPDPESNEAYLVASDTNPNYLSLNGYPVNQLYQNLAQMPANSVTVVLESCFSGVSEAGAIVQEVSPAVLSVENPIVGMEDGIAITAGAADQVSSWYTEKQHGLFTYYFLKGLRGAADADSDKAVTADELDAYLSEEVSYQAARQHNRKQTPQVVGQNRDRVLVRYDDQVPAEAQ